MSVDIIDRYKFYYTYDKFYFFEDEDEGDLFKLKIFNVYNRCIFKGSFPMDLERFKTLGASGILKMLVSNGSLRKNLFNEEEVKCNYLNIFKIAIQRFITNVFQYKEAECFTCPCKGDVVEDDPVVDRHGHLFERLQIEKSLKINNKCPLSRGVIKREELYTVNLLKQKLGDWKEGKREVNVPVFVDDFEENEKLAQLNLELAEQLALNKEYEEALESYSEAFKYMGKNLELYPIIPSILIKIGDDDRLALSYAYLFLYQLESGLMDDAISTLFMFAKKVTYKDENINLLLSEMFEIILRLNFGNEKLAKEILNIIEDPARKVHVLCKLVSDFSQLEKKELSWQFVLGIVKLNPVVSWHLVLFMFSLNVKIKGWSVALQGLEKILESFENGRDDLSAEKSCELFLKIYERAEKLLENVNNQVLNNREENRLLIGVCHYLSVIQKELNQEVDKYTQKLGLLRGKQEEFSQMCFDVSFWKRHGGNVGNFIFDRFKFESMCVSPCSVWQGKMFRDTHFSFVLPSHVDGVPFTLKRVRDSWVPKLKKDGVLPEDFNIVYDEKDLAKIEDQCIQESKLIVFPKEVMPDTTYIPVNTMVSRLEKINEKITNFSYKHSSALVTVVGMITYYIHSRGKRLFVDTEQVATCSEQLFSDRDSLRVYFKENTLTCRFYKASQSGDLGRRMGLSAYIEV